MLIFGWTISCRKSSWPYSVKAWNHFIFIDLFSPLKLRNDLKCSTFCQKWIFLSWLHQCYLNFRLKPFNFWLSWKSLIFLISPISSLQSQLTMITAIRRKKMLPWHELLHNSTTMWTLQITEVISFKTKHRLLTFASPLHSN